MAHFSFSGNNGCIYSLWASRLSQGLSLIEGHFWWGCASFSRTCASPIWALANLNTMPHTAFCIASLLTSVGGCNTLRHLLNNSVHDADNLHRKPPNSARVPSSTHGFLTSSRLSVSVVSPSISLSGSSRLLSTTSLLLMLPVTVISSRT